jgi:LCP family protein required for cell wall assembly
MADRPKDPDDGGYGWLYRPQDDDESTRRIPASRRERPAVDDPDRTQMMPSRRRTYGDERARPRPPGPPRDRRAPPPRGPAPPPGRRSAPPPSRRIPRRPHRRHWVRNVLLVLLVWLAFLVAVPLWAYSKIEKVDAEPGGGRPEATPGSTYLLVGSDSREGLTAEERKRLSTGNAGGARTDTILLLHEPMFGGPTLLVSIPRDSIVDIPGVGTTKINAAYAYGGPKLLVRTLESETGLRVDNYMEIGLGGFVNVVDAVGGVQICPDTAIDDPKAGLHVKKGCQHADGVTALGYARTREYATGDIERGQAQREVLGRVAGKAASPWSVINPFRYVTLNSAGAEALTTGENVGPIDLARFAWAMRKVTGKEGKTCTVPIADLSVHWDSDRASRMFDLIAEDSTEKIGRGLCTRDGLPH